MERGVYFDAWFPRQHNYHPSLPARRLRMIEELREYRATTLVWAALGGGSISLPYLEAEAFGSIDPRFRMYGFVNDQEFIAACDRAGIRVFATGGIGGVHRGASAHFDVSPDLAAIAKAPVAFARRATVNAATGGSSTGFTSMVTVALSVATPSETWYVNASEPTYPASGV